MPRIDTPHYTDSVVATGKVVVMHTDGRRYRLDDLAAYLDDDLMEAVHMDFAPCAAQIYWDEIVRRDPSEADHAAACAPVITAETTTAAQAIGRRGGLSGTGASQVRGDSAHYRALAAQRKRPGRRPKAK
jgi:hypothetical protein